MTDKAISPLRQRMIEDMTVRGFAINPRGQGFHGVSWLIAGSGRCREPARYQLHMRSNGVSANGGGKQFSGPLVSLKAGERKTRLSSQERAFWTDPHPARGPADIVGLRIYSGLSRARRGRPLVAKSRHSVSLR